MPGATTHVPDLAARVEMPADGIHSVTVHEDTSHKAVLFAFAAGEGLSEHTASKPAILQLIAGRMRWTLGNETIAAEPGAWASMAAGLPHALHAETDAKMLLILVQEPD